MAYMSQENKAKLAPAIKVVCKRYGIKASLAVRHHSTLVLHIQEGPIDFVESMNRVGIEKHFELRGCGWQPATKGQTLDINHHWYKEHFDGEALAFLSEVIPLMFDGNWDKSDIQTDYFNVGWYVDVRVGRWDKPYVLTDNPRFSRARFLAGCGVQS